MVRPRRAGRHALVDTPIDGDRPVTPTRTATPTPSLTRTATPTRTPTQTRTSTPTRTARASATPSPSATPVPPGRPRPVTIALSRFAPRDLTLRKRDAVVWRNVDRVAHQVQIVGGPSSPRLEPPRGGGRTGTTFVEWTHAFEAAGRYEYFCVLVPTMRGTVTVR